MTHKNHCDWPARHAALLDGEASGVCGPSNQRTGKFVTTQYLAVLLRSWVCGNHCEMSGFKQLEHCAVTATSRANEPCYPCGKSTSEERICHASSLQLRHLDEPIHASHFC